jgi:hypothetical protein
MCYSRKVTWVEYTASFITTNQDLDPDVITCVKKPIPREASVEILNNQNRSSGLKTQIETTSHNNLRD